MKIIFSEKAEKQFLKLDQPMLKSDTGAKFMKAADSGRLSKINFFFAIPAS